MIKPEEFLETVKRGKESSSFALGTVIQEDPLLVRLDGHGEALQQEVKRLGSYTPTEDDRVLLAVIRGKYVVLGSLI